MRATRGYVDIGVGRMYIPISIHFSSSSCKVGIFYIDIEIMGYLCIFLNNDDHRSVST